MNHIPQPHRRPRMQPNLLAVGIVAIAGVLSACGGSSTSTPSQQAGTSVNAAPIGPVLPVASNPITNASTVEALRIDSVLVENNVDSTGADVADHLEIALSNTGTSELTTFEIFYTFSDPTTSVAESYYVALPSDFVIPAGGQRIAHFDNTGMPDHFAVNEFSLYATDTNALDVSVTVSAVDAAVQTVTVQKDAGGAETAD
jgi:hypothetical protein